MTGYYETCPILRINYKMRYASYDKEKTCGDTSTGLWKRDWLSNYVLGKERGIARQGGPNPNHRQALYSIYKKIVN